MPSTWVVSILSKLWLWCRTQQKGMATACHLIFWSVSGTEPGTFVHARHMFYCQATASGLFLIFILR